MTSDQLDHAAIVEAWLKEPVWLPEGDTARIAQLVHQTPQQHGWLRPILTRRAHDMITVTKFATAGIVLATTGWLLLAGGGLFPQTNESLPGASAAASTQPDASTTPEASVTPQSSVAPEPTSEASIEGALVLTAPAVERSAGGWTQAGRAPYGPASELRDLQVVGDTLVARTEDSVLVSADGQTWVPAAGPWNRPTLNHLAGTSDGLVLGGLERVDGERVARLWTSSDGREWVEMAAPEGVTTVSQIVSAQDPLAVRSNQRLFELEDDGTWTDLGRIPDSQILRGPSGYITWQGGGQDLRHQLSLRHQSELGGEISEVSLPGRLGRGNLAQIGVQLYAVGDQWIMVPEGIDTPIYVSDDGFEWREVPRPDRMLGGYVEWMGMVGDELQAFGLQQRQNTSPSGVWTIDLESSDAAPFEMLDRAGDQHLNPPVEFDGGSFATGYFGGRGNAITAWQHTAE